MVPGATLDRGDTLYVVPLVKQWVPPHQRRLRRRLHPLFQSECQLIAAALEDTSAVQNVLHSQIQRPPIFIATGLDGTACFLSFGTAGATAQGERVFRRLLAGQGILELLARAPGEKDEDHWALG